MKILISGSNGQLAIDIIKVLKEREDCDLFIYDRHKWDITDQKHSEYIFYEIKPDFYINGASIHNVEEIETDPLRAFEVNVLAPKFLANLCNINETMFVNFSTNYVLSAAINVPVKEGDNTSGGGVRVKPVNLYGITKAANEQVLDAYCKKFCNFRVAGLFGAAGSRAKKNSNFIFAVLDKIINDEEMKVVNDQCTNISYTKDIAKTLSDKVFKTYMKMQFWENTNTSLCNQGNCTWFEVAKYVAKRLNRADLITSCKSSDFYSKTKRAYNTSMYTAFSDNMPDWKDAIDRFLIQEVVKLPQYKRLFT